MNDLPLVVPESKFFLVRHGIWYEISKHDFKHLVKSDLYDKHKSQLTMDVFYFLDDDYIVIHRFYKLKSIRWFDLEFNYIMYGVNYGKT